MIRTLVSAAALLAFVAGAAPALAAESPNDLICTYDQDTGSHIKKRICTTRAVRDAQQKQGRDTLNRAANTQSNQAQMQRTASGGAPR